MTLSRNAEMIGDRNIYEDLLQKVRHESAEVQGHGRDLRHYQTDLIRHNESLSNLLDGSRRFFNLVERLIEENRKQIGRIKDLENLVVSLSQSLQSQEKTAAVGVVERAADVEENVTSSVTTETEEESDNDNDAAKILINLSSQNESPTSSPEQPPKKKEDLGLGCRFQPSDQELIVFLKKKIAGGNIPKHITERNLYGSDEPEAIFNGNPASELYFVTKIKKKFDSGKKNNRVVGNGTWKIQNNKDIYENPSDKTKIIGVKKTLNFMDKNWDKNKKKEEKISWIMHEYNLDSPADNPERWAICRIKRGPGNRIGLESCSPPPSVSSSYCRKRPIENVDDSVLPKKKRTLETIDLSLSLAQPTQENNAG